MKVLIGMNPKAHVLPGTDELYGLNKIGFKCKSTRYGRKNYSVQGHIQRLFDTVLNSFSIVSTLYTFSPDILYLNSRLEPLASVRDCITVFLVKCFYYKKLKIAIKSHGSDMSTLTRKSFLYKRIVIPYLTRHVDLWLFLSREEKNTIGKYNTGIAEKVFVTCNIIEPSRLISSAEFRKKYKLNNDKLKIIFIGRVVAEKGVFEFLKAIPLVDRKEKCDFILVGDGKDFTRAKQLARELSLNSYLRFIGWVEEAEIECFYDCVDMLIMPTFHPEGFSMVLFNAVASGLPVVTTRIRAAVDHLKMPENVIWVEPKSERQVADAINELIINEALRNKMSANNKRLASRFSRDKVCH